MSSHCIALAFDVGLKRTGVAVAQITAEKAQPVGVIQVVNGRHDWLKVDQAITDWLPSVVILGQVSDTDLALRKAANRLLSHIQKQHKITTIQVDETLTTVNANELLNTRDYSSSKRRELRDQVAACLILETWLQSKAKVVQQ
jgi:putative Holliday junction resolvase